MPPSRHFQNGVHASPEAPVAGSHWQLHQHEQPGRQEAGLLRIKGCVLCWPNSAQPSEMPTLRHPKYGEYAM